MRKLLAVLAAICALALCSCAAPSEEKPLPRPEADEKSDFGVDKNINQQTIDRWLGREDVAYRDVRMLFDPAQYGEIGGEADLTRTISGFKVVPYPYIATLQALPVGGAYEGEALFSVEWSDDGSILSVSENYEESMLILEELFPKDKALFLMCGGGGYAGMMKTLLLHLGWNGELLYNIGANWSYTGENALELVVYPEDAGGENIYATWRADYAHIDFSRLHPVG